MQEDAEFLGDGVAALTHHRLERLQDAEAGFERITHAQQTVQQLQIEPLHAALPEHVEDHPRGIQRRQGGEEAKDAAARQAAGTPEIAEQEKKQEEAGQRGETGDVQQAPGGDEQEDVLEFPRCFRRVGAGVAFHALADRQADDVRQAGEAQRVQQRYEHQIHCAFQAAGSKIRRLTSMPRARISSTYVGTEPVGSNRPWTRCSASRPL